MSDPFKEAEVSSEKSPLVTYWSNEVDLSLKREKKYRKQAAAAVKIYEVEDSTENSFNILYANTETLLPAIYNNSPRPVVDRRFHDADPLGKCASDTVERTLSYLLDTNSDEYEHYHSLFRQAVLMALVPGRGVTWWKYDPKIVGEDVAKGKDEEGNPDQVLAGVALPSKGRVTWETVCGEDVNYDDFLMGFARRWIDVPWVARRHGMTKDDAAKNFGKELAGKLTYLRGAFKDPDAENAKAEDENNNQGSAEVCEVYEIWNKSKREVIFFAPTYKDELLKTVDDPLGLPGFFPCYRPLHFLKKTSCLVPTPVYEAYKSQAKELNRISLRINRVLNAIKVRGFYDGTIQGLQELLSKDDNTLIPAKNTASFQGGQTLANSIWLMPLEQLINVLNELYAAENQCKNKIYEITGIADIMRGDTQASETATAQNIKNKWGTLRLQNMQGAVQDYVRGCLRIVAVLAGKHFGIETFSAMTGLDYATPQQVQQAQQMQQQAQQQLLLWQQQQAQQAQPMPAPMPGGPPSAAPPPAQPPQPPPQLVQALQQAQAILAKPQWEQVVGMLRDDLERQYRIDIETNSTLSDTSAEDQQNITNAMTAIANTASSFEGMISEGIFPMPAFKEMLLSIVRRFEFGRTVEASIQAIPDQVPPKTDPKADAAAQKLQQDQMELEQQKTQFAQEQAQQQASLNEQQQDMTAQQQQAAADMQAREQALDAKTAEVSNQIAAGQKELMATVKQAQDAADIARQKAELALEKRLQKSEMANQQRNNDLIAQVKAERQGQQMENEKSKLAMQAEKAKPEPAPANDQHAEAIKHLTKGHEDLSKMVREAMQMIQKPRRLEVTRDSNGRPTGGISTLQ